MNELYYLAYGSNLHPVRLMKRVPSASLLGKVELINKRIVFHKRSIDHSGKCTMVRDETNKPVAYGALFAMNPDEVVLLDRFEGCGHGYDRQAIVCNISNMEYHAFTYLATSKAIDVSLRPYHWYKQLVLAGARYHGFPEDYISHLERVESIPDPDRDRRIVNEELLKEIERF